MTDPDEFHHRLHGVLLNCGSGCDLIVMKAAVIYRDSFFILYLHGFYCTSTEKDPVTLRDVPNYVFCVCGSQVMKMIGNKGKGSSSKNTSEQNRRETEGQNLNDMEIVKLALTNREDSISVENPTAASFGVFEVSDYQRTSLFVIIERIKDSDIPLRYVGLLQVTSLRILFRMYGSSYSRDALY